MFQQISVINAEEKYGNPYNVFEINTFDILDFEALSERIGTNYFVNTSKEKVQWSIPSNTKFQDS